jgi:hypothetical protein
MHCAACGFENRAEARFCRHCGAALLLTPPSPSKASVCTHCGAALRPDTRFCAQCGHPVFAAHVVENAPSPQLGDAPEGYAVSLSGRPSWTTSPAPDSRHDEAVVPPLIYAGAPAASDGETQEVGYALPAYPAIPVPPSTFSRRPAVPRWAWLVGGIVLVVIIVVLMAAFLLLNAFVLHLF